MIAFMHIPRTAGTSFQRCATTLYGNTYTRGPGPYFGRRHDQLIRAKKHRIHCYAAHMSYDPGVSNLQWVTLIRDPIERIISHFYLKVLRKTPEYIDLDIWQITDDDKWREHHFGAEDNGTMKECGSNLMMNMFAGGSGSIDEAMENARRFALIGHIERLHAFVRKYRTQFTVGSFSMSKINMNHKRPQLQMIPIACIDWLRKHNSRDIELLQRLEAEGLIA